MNNPPPNSRSIGQGSQADRSLLAFLALEAVGGALATASLFAAGPSMERNALALGYSLPRLLLGLMAGGLALLLFGAAVTVWLRPSGLRRLLTVVDATALAHPMRTVDFGLVLLGLSVVGGYFLMLLGSSTVSDATGLPRIVAQATFWIVAWLTSLPLFCLVLVIERWRKPEGYLRSCWDAARQRVVAFCVVLFAWLHWLTVGLEARWLLRVKGWFWPYTPKALAAPHVWMLVAALLGMGLGYWAFRLPRKPVGDVLVSIAAAYLLQVAFGFAGGQGYESIREKYDRTQFSDVIQIACESPMGTMAAVRNYEGIFRVSFWYGTKPPGLFMFFSLAADAVQDVFPDAEVSSNACNAILTGYLARLGPFLAALVVLPILGLQRQLGYRPWTLLGPLLAMSTPGMLLMLLAPDQMLFPLLAASTVFLWVAALAKQSPAIGVLAGALMGISTFVSFSLLPILGFAGIFWVLVTVSEGEGAERRRQLSVGVAAVLGLAGIVVVQAVALHYDPIGRWLSAMALHREIKGHEFTLGSLLQYGVLNTLEFAVWAGLPLIVLTVGGTWRALLSAVRGKGSLGDMFSVALLGMYLMLNVVGQTRGEVGRLWLFLVPLMAVTAAKEATKLFRWPALGAMLVLALQLTSSVVGFYRLDWPW